DLARTAEVRSDAIHRGGATQPASVRLGAFRRRRAYVPRPAFRLYAGQVLCTALPAKPRSLHEPRLQAGLADMADPQAARRPAGDDEAGVRELSFRDGPKDQTRNLEVPGSMLTHRPGMTAIRLHSKNVVSC